MQYLETKPKPRHVERSSSSIRQLSLSLKLNPDPSLRLNNSRFVDLLLRVACILAHGQRNQISKPTKKFTV